MFGLYQHGFSLPARVLLQDAQRSLQGPFSLGNVGDVHTGELAGGDVSIRLGAGGCKNKEERRENPSHSVACVHGCGYRHTDIQTELEQRILLTQRQ